MFHVCYALFTSHNLCSHHCLLPIVHSTLFQVMTDWLMMEFGRMLSEQRGVFVVGMLSNKCEMEDGNALCMSDETRKKVESNKFKTGKLLLCVLFCVVWCAMSMFVSWTYLSPAQCRQGQT